jgi:serine/threonine protein kinase
MKTVLMIADKVLASLEFIHLKNFVHRDIEPGNLLVGLGKKLHQIYTIDFAVATPYNTTIDAAEQERKKHRPDNMNNADKIIGTSRFSSLNVQQGHRHSRRDDLESLGLILIYFLKGSLPWDLPESDLSPKQMRKEILRKMEATSLEELCFGIPKEFTTYMQYCRSLKYEDSPDYNYLKRLFK